MNAQHSDQLNSPSQAQQHKGDMVGPPCFSVGDFCPECESLKVTGMDAVLDHSVVNHEESDDFY